MEGTPQKPKSCQFCRVRSFCGSNFQGPLGFAGFPASWTAEMEETPQKPTSCRFCTKAPSDLLDVRLLGPPKWRELPHKSRKVVDFVSHFQGPFGLLDFRLVGLPKWREPHKSPKVVDFVEPAPFAEAISKAPSDLLDFRLLAPLAVRSLTLRSQTLILERRAWIFGPKP